MNFIVLRTDSVFHDSRLAQNLVMPNNPQIFKLKLELKTYLYDRNEAGSPG